MRIERTSCIGWDQNPVFYVPTDQDYNEICRWMAEHQVDHFMISTGSHGHTFQVLGDNTGWFVLQWA